MLNLERATSTVGSNTIVILVIGYGTVRLNLVEYLLFVHGILQASSVPIFVKYLLEHFVYLLPFLV